MSGPKPMPPVEKFWRHVRTSRDCWEWTASRLPRGYGRFHPSAKAKTVSAHRYSYELHIGPIPEGMDVCHHCDNPPCVNPAHLFVGTRSDNMRDMVAKNRHGSRPRSHCKRGHALTPDNRLTSSPSRCRTCHNARNVGAPPRPNRVQYPRKRAVA